MYANTDVCNHPCSAVSRIFKAKNLLHILTKSSRLLWPPTSSQRQLGGQLFSSQVVMFKNFDEKAAVMTIIIFCTCCYNCSQCTNHGCKLLQTTFQMCLILWTHGHSNTVVVFDSNDLSWLSLEVPLWFIGRVSYYYYKRKHRETNISWDIQFQHASKLLFPRKICREKAQY